MSNPSLNRTGNHPNIEFLAIDVEISERGGFFVRGRLARIFSVEDVAIK